MGTMCYQANRPHKSGSVEEDLLQWAHVYIESFLGLVAIAFRSKVPLRDPKTASWQRIRDKEELSELLKRHGRLNLAIELNKESPVVALEWDSAEGARCASSLNVRHRDRNWIRKSRRGYAVFYARPTNFSLDTARPPDRPLEFISTGLLIVAPSVHPTGIPYTWIDGHSPQDLSVHELDDPPPELLVEWQRLARPRSHQRSRTVVILAPEIQARLRSLLRQKLGNYHERGAQITGYTDSQSAGKHHISVDLERGVFFNFRTLEGGPIADLLAQLGVSVPRITPRGKHMRIEVGL